MERRAHWATLVCVMILAWTAAAQQAVILVRHAEKETNPQALQGLADKDVPLSEAGKERARALASHLKDAGVDAIYTSFAKRTQLTAEPLAKAIGKKPAVLGRDTIKKLSDRNKDQIVLIVAHSGGALGVPQFIDQITGKANDVAIADDEYGHLFILTPKKDGSWSVIRARYGAVSRAKS